MSFIKWFLGICLTAIIIILLAVLILPRVIDPNDYRAQIASQASQALGRNIELNGELSLSVFPWLGVDVSDVRIAQPEGVKKQLSEAKEFLQVANAQLRLKLMPLLGKRVEVDTIVLVEPEIHFVKINDSLNSLSGLGETADSKPNTPEPTDAGQMGEGMEQGVVLLVQGVQIQDASFVYEDYSVKPRTGAPERYSLSEANLEIGNLLSEKYVPLAIKARASAPSAYQAPLEVQLNADVRLDIQARNIETKTISVSVSSVEAQPQKVNLELASLSIKDQFSKLSLGQLEGDVILNLPSETGELQPVNAQLALEQLKMDVNALALTLDTVSLDANVLDHEVELDLPSVQANLQTGVLSAPSIKARSGELDAKVSSLKVVDFLDAPKAKGSLSINEFSLVKLLSDLGVDYELKSDAPAQVSFNTSFAAGLDNISLSGIQARLDESTLSGDLSVRDFALPEISFDLNSNGINVDDYLPESANDESAGVGDQGDVSGVEALAVPMAIFKQFRANGAFKADYLVFNGAKLEQVDVQVVSNAEKVEIIPNASLYDGGIKGRIVYSENNNQPELRIKQSIDLVSLGSLLSDAGITDQLSGIGSLDIDVSVIESEGQQSNKGTIKLLAKNGALKGVDIKKVLDDAQRQYDRLKGKEAVSEAQDGEVAEGDFNENDETRFAELLGTIELDNFNLKNNDFSLKAPLFRINGSGGIDIAKQSLNYLTKISVVNTSKGQGGDELDKLKGITLPVRFKGSLTSPDFSIDLKELYRIAAKRKIEEKKSKLVQEKLGIEGGGQLSTKDILRAAAAKRIDEKYGTGKSQAESNTGANASGTANQEAANEESSKLDAAEKANAEPLSREQTREQEKEQAKDQLKEDVKNLLLDGLFGK